jgi:hypothetical protein
VPTGARRAAEWRPSPEGSRSDSWFLSGTAGIAYFSGDNAVDDEPGFVFEARAARELTSGFYVVGSYILGFAQTEVTDINGDTHDDTHTFHIPSVGVGFRADVTPNIYLFVEPRVGGIFGDDVDAGPVAGASAGAEFELSPGLLVHIRLTGLFAETSLQTPAGDADLDGIFSVGVGLTWEF